MDKELLLSAEGLRKLEEELQYLKSVKRREVAQRIKQAREFGDISENSEYEEAKNEQAFVEGRIIELEKMLRNARIVNDDEIDPTKVNIGSTVYLKDVDTGEEVQYTIVGSNEADPAALRISYQSPVGKALFGHSVGDVVEVKVPAGTLRYEIVRIERAG
ncbi:MULTISPECIES: transcription elongation factor GreA [Thermaerobacter]|uniref:Transcription elongation factor GreA n=1 Tax=Thermaerobacter subterraneus DSM 13965 TaxID=867903 RepID=K6QFS2_9FIRM|nr:MULTISPECIES: transcription elongation factor GreA [Thermaerobacter]EKP95911.1 transcription elongation factor GreA [Thermaerobacter subterraneus DSM 13965]QIA26210.1 transcription elongation factor GreA [Thermaerobacter sp. PB12/4term]